MIVDTISDLHGFYPKLQGGDLLIIAGDLTARDDVKGYCDFFLWLASQDYRKKIFIAGNHDNRVIAEDYKTDQVNFAHTYLEDSGTEFEGLKIWGSPWSLWFKGINPRCSAFTGSEEDLAKQYAKIPDDTDILITHGPAYGFGDKVDREEADEFGNVHEWEESVGSKSLLKWVANHSKTLKMHVFGHIHEGYGIWDTREAKRMADDPIPSPVLVNASYVNERYRPGNKPIRVIL